MKKSPYLIIILALLLVVVLNGCGGSSSPKTLSITSTASLDGDLSCINPDNMTFWDVLTFTRNSFFNQNILIRAQLTGIGTEIAVQRGLLSFDLGGLAGKTITNVVLKVHFAVEPSNWDPDFLPVGSVGFLKVDHFTTNYTTGTTDNDLFRGISISTSVPEQMDEMDDEEGWFSINVTDEVLSDQDAERSSQYRLHFERELNATLAHEITIESGNNANNKPVLMVTYQRAIPEEIHLLPNCFSS